MYTTWGGGGGDREREREGSYKFVSDMCDNVYKISARLL